MSCSICVSLWLSVVDALPLATISLQVGEPVDIPWFDPVTGARNIEDHPQNARRHVTVDETYEQSLMKRGLVEGVRGAAWMVFSVGNQLPALAITYASLSRAFYGALLKQPLNPQLLNTLNNGLRKVRMLDFRTPAKVIRHLRDYHNQFHSGAFYSFLELMGEIKHIEAEFKNFALARGITSSISSGENSYEKQYWRWVQSHHEGNAQSWRHFDTCKSLVHRLERYEILDTFIEWGVQNINFLEARLQSSVVIMNMHSFTSVVETTLIGYHPRELQQLVMLEGIKQQVTCCFSTRAFMCVSLKAY